jgi:hypothetical protein
MGLTKKTLWDKIKMFFKIIINIPPWVWLVKEALLVPRRCIYYWDRWGAVPIPFFLFDLNAKLKYNTY